MAKSIRHARLGYTYHFPGLAHPVASKPSPPRVLENRHGARYPRHEYSAFFFPPAPLIFLRPVPCFSSSIYLALSHSPTDYPATRFRPKSGPFNSRAWSAMKFGKSLNNQIVETLPEWRDKFLSYKDLKKRLKLLGSGERQSKRQRVGDGSPPAMTAEEAAFVALLEAELDKFNGFFLGKEEDYVIRQKELQDRVVLAAETGSPDELMRVRKEIVDLHGEMVLLENYSLLNYTGMVKILKKYDKRTGALIRLPFIQSVMQEPFFTTDLLCKLVKDCEAILEQLLPRSQPSVTSEDRREDSDGDDKPANPSASLANGGTLELEDIEVMESMYMKSTVAALRVLKEIRSGSSTVSAFSLPPLHGAHEQQEG